MFTELVDGPADHRFVPERCHFDHVLPVGAFARWPLPVTEFGILLDSAPTARSNRRGTAARPSGEQHADGIVVFERGTVPVSHRFDHFRRLHHRRYTHPGEAV